jgi:hypothetical protein
MTNRPNLTEEEKEHYNKVAMDMIHNKTPRTDKAEPQIRFIKSGWVRSDFARELELELNALKKELYGDTEVCGDAEGVPKKEIKSEYICEDDFQRIISGDVDEVIVDGVKYKKVTQTITSWRKKP